MHNGKIIKNNKQKLVKGNGLGRAIQVASKLMQHFMFKPGKSQTR